MPSSKKTKGFSTGGLIVAENVEDGFRGIDFICHNPLDAKKNVRIVVSTPLSAVHPNGENSKELINRENVALAPVYNDVEYPHQLHWQGS